MRERPILFSAPMVRAILGGRKTQTRRVMKPQHFQLDGGGRPFTQLWDDEEQINWRRDMRCPYGVPGDRLWVRETIERGPMDLRGFDSAVYAADGAPTRLDSWGWKRNSFDAQGGVSCGTSEAFKA